MQTNWKQAAFLLIAIVTIVGVSAHAQTDISASVYGTFNNTTTGNGTIQSAANSGGGMIGARHIFSPLVGLEFNFGVRGSTYSLASVPSTCGARCSNQPITLSGIAPEFTADYVVSAKFGNLRPFGLAGLGFVFTDPTGSAIGTNSLSRPAWVGGGGADWNFASRLGLRMQYRALFYKAPDVFRGYSPTGEYVHTQEPMIGAFVRF
ncbi:MAG: outer membrane protein [Terracidiphilus sp.]